MQTILKIFAHPTLAQVLCLFFFNPEETFYQAQLVRETGKSLIQVQRSLKEVVKTGLVSMYHRGRKAYYKAVRSHPAFEDLKRAFIRTIGLGDSIREEAHKHHHKIQFAWVFGSVARGEERKTSDIDLMVISNLSLLKLSEVIGPVQENCSREINQVSLTPENLYKKWHDKDYFIQEIIQRPKIWLIGSDHELSQFLAKTPPSTAISSKG